MEEGKRGERLSPFPTTCTASVISKGKAKKVRGRWFSFSCYGGSTAMPFPANSDLDLSTCLRTWHISGLRSMWCFIWFHQLGDEDNWFLFRACNKTYELRHPPSPALTPLSAPSMKDKERRNVPALSLGPVRTQRLQESRSKNLLKEILTHGNVSKLLTHKHCHCHIPLTERPHGGKQTVPLCLSSLCRGGSFLNRTMLVAGV